MVVRTTKPLISNVHPHQSRWIISLQGTRLFSTLERFANESCMTEENMKLLEQNTHLKQYLKALTVFSTITVIQSLYKESTGRHL